MATSAKYAQFVREAIRAYLPAWIAQRDHALAIAPYLEGKHPLPITPDARTSAELDALRQLSATPWGRLIVGSCVQNMKVIGLRVPDEDGPMDAWETVWKRNRMDARQAGLVHNAVGYGVAYTSVLPGELGIEGEMGVRWKHFSPQTMTAFYDEDDDEFPAFAMNGVEQVESNGKKYHLFSVYDDRAIHWARVDDLGTIASNDIEVTYISSEPHNADVTPIVSHRSQMLTDGAGLGELVPFLPVIGRLDQVVYDRLVIQRNAAFTTRTIAGVAKPKSDEQRARQKAEMKAGDLLVSEDSNTKFGSLPGSSMMDHIAAEELEKKTLSAVSQTPPYLLSGDSSNMAPESLAAVTSGFYGKIESYQTSIGTSIEQAFRLSAHIDSSIGDMPENAEVRWKGFRPYSLTQVADSLGKLAQQLQIPVEMLWERVPDFTDGDIERASRLKAEMEAELAAQAALEAEAAGAAQTGSNSPNWQRANAADSNQNARS